MSEEAVMNDAEVLAKWAADPGWPKDYNAEEMRERLRRVSVEIEERKLKPRIDRHHDDPWSDTIILNGVSSDYGNDRSFRLVIRERYKTSGLSGDEWRFSYLWQVQKGAAWEDLDGPYSWQDAAIAAFFPAFRTSHPDWHNETCYSIQFLWKGQPLAEMSDDGKPQPMLHAIGSLAWAKMVAREQIDWKVDDSNVCAQPGCRVAPCSLFRKIDDYHERIGVKREQYWESYRRFCKKHLRRGDCGLDDADRNYELIEGVGPDGNEPDPNVVKQSVFGGSIRL